MVSPSPTSRNSMRQEHIAKPLAIRLENEDRLSRLLCVLALSCLSVAGIVFFVSDIVELIQVLVADAGVRHP